MGFIGPQIGLGKVTSNSISFWGRFRGSQPGMKYCLFHVDGNYLDTDEASGLGNNDWTTKTVTAYGLSPNTEYQLKVTFRDSDYGNDRVFMRYITTESEYSPPPQSRPPTPTNFHASWKDDGKVQLRWDASPGADSYEIDMDRNLMITTTGTTASISGLSPGTEYMFDLYARNDAGFSGRSRIYVTTDSLPVAPSTPTLSILNSNIGTNSFKVSVYASPSPDGYDLQYRRSDRINWGAHPGKYSPFTVTGLTTGATYEVRARAYIGDLYSSWSSIRTVTLNTPIPSKPTGLEVRWKDDTRIGIGWDASSGADYYQVYMDGEHMIDVGGTVASVAQLTPGTSYWFTVYACNDSGCSSPSGITGTTDHSPPSTPTISFIDSGVSMFQVRLTSTPAPSGYEMQYRRSDRISWGTHPSNNSVITTTGLTAGATYEVRARAYIGNAYSSWSSIRTIDLDDPRPKDWKWEYTISSGGSFYSQSGKTAYVMRASHWNEFTKRVNEFRKYKGLSQRTFTTATSSMSSSQVRVCINEGIGGVNGVTPSTKMSTISSGDVVKASIFTDLRNKLNAVQ